MLSFGTILMSQTSVAATVFSPSKTSLSADTVPPSQAIIKAVAAHEGIDVTDVEPPEYDPLYTVVNPEALNELFDSTPAMDDEASQKSTDQSDDTLDDIVRSVVLRYEGYRITVHSDGCIEVADPSSDESVTDPFGE